MKDPETIGPQHPSLPLVLEAGRQDGGEDDSLAGPRTLLSASFRRPPVARRSDIPHPAESPLDNQET